jgi:membrane associated rhomboid family serine protease
MKNVMSLDNDGKVTENEIEIVNIGTVSNNSNVQLPSKFYKFLHFPTFTILVSIVDIVLFIWIMIMGGFAPPSDNPMLGPPAQTLLDAGGKWTPFILQGEWWRLIAPTFLHAGFVHIAMNLLAQIVLGWYLETKYGTIRYCIIYLFSGIGGILTSAIFIPKLLSVGASGALYGIIAMWCIDVFQDISKMKYPICSIITVVSLIIVSFAFGLLPYTDNFAHIGGFIFGLELSLILILRYEWDRIWKIRLRYIITIIAIAIFLLQFIGFFYILYHVDVVKLCPNCQYVSCIPVVVNGVNWCNL